MRGSDRRAGELFSCVNLEARVRPNHPLRTILKVVNAALEGLSADFAELYSHTGRPSIAPEMLLRAMLLQAFYSIRSERQLMERLEFDLLFRWFVGIGVDDPAWDHSVFSKNRDRLLEGEIAAKFLGGDTRPAADQEAPVHRSLFGRRHADRGVGANEVVQAGRRRRQRSAGGRRAQHRGRLGLSGILCGGP
jgi:transposase